MEVKKIALDSEAKEQAELMGKDAFKELQKLAASLLINKVHKFFFLLGDFPMDTPLTVLR